MVATLVTMPQCYSKAPSADPAHNGVADAGAQAGDFEVDPVTR